MDNRNKDIFYRTTTNVNTLKLIDQDIFLALGKSGNPSTFNAAEAIIMTYDNVPKYGDRSKRFKFQVVIATDYTNTFAILNYDRLDESGGVVGYGDSGYCPIIKTFTNSTDTRILNQTSNVGRPGKHIHLLTVKSVKDCLKELKSSMIVREENQRLSDVFKTHKQEFSSVIKLNNVLFHLKEAVTSSVNPIVITLLNSSSQTSTNYSSQYITFNPGKEIREFQINNLFIFNNTIQSSSFQFGDLKFGFVSTQTKCEKYFFEKVMDSTPTMKIMASVNGNEFKDHVNVWLENVSSVGFTACVKEMIAFSGKREVGIKFIAATSKSKSVQESIHIDHESNKDDLSDSCTDKPFQNKYLSTPYVFTSIEIVGNTSTRDPPALVWVKQVSITKATVCVRSSKKAKYRIHLITKGTIYPCVNYSCPSHLECQLDSTLMPYCGCIQDCTKYNSSGEFCGSDLHNYQSVCMMNKEHCQQFGMKSKSNVTIKYHGSCQGLLNNRSFRFEGKLI